MAPAPSASLGPALAARPAELRLDGIDPCALLTAAQRAQFGLRDLGAFKGEGDRFMSVGCLWGNSSLPPYGSPLVKLVVAQGVQYYLDPGKAPTIVEVGGFSAVQTAGAYVDPERHCLVLVDVAPGQTLWAQYSNDGGPPNGINNKIACEKARETAGAMVATLRAQLRK